VSSERRSGHGSHEVYVELLPATSRPLQHQWMRGRLAFPLDAREAVRCKGVRGCHKGGWQPLNGLGRDHSAHGPHPHVAKALVE